MEFNKFVPILPIEMSKSGKRKKSFSIQYVSREPMYLIYNKYLSFPIFKVFQFCENFFSFPS